MSTARFHPGKLATLSATAAFLVRQWDELSDPQIAHEMLREGLRKLHDHADSHRGPGKYLGHACWSQGALRVLRDANGKRKDYKNSLRHEHVVPARVVVDLLVCLGKSATPDLCAKLIERYAVVAIITRKEDLAFSANGLSNRMPDGWDGQDIWARYKLVGLYEQIAID